MTDTMPIWTDEIPAPWLRPPVTNVHLTLHARARRARSRFAASLFMADVRKAYAATFWWRCLVAGLLVAFFLIATRHNFMAWDGIHSILTGGH